jgi:spore coat protein CotH
MKRTPFIVVFLLLVFYSCVDDGNYTPPEEDDTNYIVTEPSDGSIADGVSGTFPLFMRYSDADHRLITGVVSQVGIYEEAVIRRIDLTFSAPDWETTLQDNETSGNELAATLTYNGSILPYQVGVRYKGSLAGGEGTAVKRSFNISIDYDNEDAALNGGYYTLVLNGGYEDNTFVHEAIYRHCIQKYIPASQVNYVNLHINGTDYGLYVNTEHLNGLFIREWFLSSNGSRWRAEPAVTGEGTEAGLYGTGFSGLNYLGESSVDYEPYYSLKNNSDKDIPLEDLIEVCRALEQEDPDSLELEIRKVLDLDRTLWFLACENIFTDEDGYVNKGGTDYYLYWDLETDRVTPLEYDGNDTFGEENIQWDPFFHADNDSFPLLSKLLRVPSIRQRYLAHYRTILSETYNTAYLNGVIDAWASTIDSAMQADTRQRMTYNEFKTAVTNMKSVIAQRSAFLSEHDSIAINSLTISDVSWKVDGTSWTLPTMNDTVAVTATISGGGTIGVFLCAGTGMVGDFRRLQMFDDGNHGDVTAGDGVYTALINPQSTGVRVRFYIEAVRGNASRTRTYMPAGAEHDVYSYIVG